MTDDIDRAQSREQTMRDDAIATIRLQPVLTYSGTCYNCEVPIDRGCFCDGDCRDDYERLTRLSARVRN